MMAGNGERLKGSQLGYRGKGVPDLDTIFALQDTYAAAMLAGGLPPAILAKYNRLQQLVAKSTDEDKKAETFAEAAALAREVMPILHFKADDVDWDS
jgi:hypothetical protein